MSDKTLEQQLEGLIDRMLANERPQPGIDGRFMALAWKLRELEKKVEDLRFVVKTGLGGE